PRLEAYATAWLGGSLALAVWCLYRHRSFPCSLCWSREQGKRSRPDHISGAQAVAQRERPA
ncbi:MAG TPA: hypothetical protein VGI81_04585, partial [Tepidisphaeraceae bacterium]